MLFALVALAVVGLLSGVHWYLWRRLVRDTTARGGRARRAGTVAAVVLPLISVGALVSGRAGAPFALQRALAWPGYLWLALVLYLTLALLAGEAVRPLLRRWLERRDAARSAQHGPVPAASPAGPLADLPAGLPAKRAPVAVGAVDEAVRPEPDTATATDTATDNTTATDTAAAPPPPSRRLFVARTVAAGAAAVAAGTVGYGTYTVLRGPRLKRVTVPLAKLPRQAHGFRIAVVSDIHLGPILGRAHTRRIVETINRTSPDLIAVVGDLVDGSVEDLGPAAEPLRGLRARHGSYFVTGNHEYFSGAAQWVDHVRELGLRPLENQRTELRGFDLAGVNDVAGEDEGQGPDFEAALGDRDPARACVLLAHQPVVIHDAVDHGVDLQLSGHTHGGQMWPGNYVAELANPTAAGLERYGDTQLYVTRGAGAWGPPVRVGAPPDITVVELAAARA
ncbi:MULTISPECIES: metallophosphoesterase [unclassified Streptomyces]|uniref:metallophosphoesterase n=1 Tax=unclassified Streptomyces TaxID=2593676 RepID=UPI00336AEAAE